MSMCSLTADEKYGTQKTNNIFKNCLSLTDYKPTAQPEVGIIVIQQTTESE